MKRLLIFILLCPLGVVVPVAVLGSSDLIENPGLFLFGLELAFLAGLPAAVISMIADWVLAKNEEQHPEPDCLDQPCRLHRVLRTGSRFQRRVAVYRRTVWCNSSRGVLVAVR